MEASEASDSRARSPKGCADCVGAWFRDIDVMGRESNVIRSKRLEKKH